MEQCLYQLETLIQTDSIAKAKKNGASKAIQKHLQHQQLTPIESLKHIRKWFPSVVRELQLDYISLVRTCNTLLRKVRQTINDEICDAWGQP